MFDFYWCTNSTVDSSPGHLFSRRLRTCPLSRHGRLHLRNRCVILHIGELACVVVVASCQSPGLVHGAQLEEAGSVMEKQFLCRIYSCAFYAHETSQRMDEASSRSIVCDKRMARWFSCFPPCRAVPVLYLPPPHAPFHERRLSLSFFLSRAHTNHGIDQFCGRNQKWDTVDHCFLIENWLALTRLLGRL